MTGDRDEDQPTPTTEDMIDDCEAELAAVANRTHFSVDQRMDEARPVIDSFIGELWQFREKIGGGHDFLNIVTSWTVDWMSDRAKQKPL